MATTLFVVTTPGLEDLTARELTTLGHPPAAVEPGGITLEGAPDLIPRLNQHLTTATRVVMRLGTFKAVSFPALRREAAALPWKNVLKKGAPVALRVTCHKSRLYHSGGVAQRLAEAMGDTLGVLPSVEKPAEEPGPDAPQLVLARMDHDLCTVSVDTSGALLHRRGYRQAIHDAPLRETFAAAMLLAAGWDGKTPVVDPCCGSGTLLTEAFLRASGTVVGRAYAFERWPAFRDWRAPTSPAATGTAPLLLGVDRDAKALDAAAQNSARLAAPITWTQGDALELLPPGATPGLLVSNLPYGVRVDSGRALHQFHQALGRHWRQHWKGWRVCVLSVPPLLNALDLRWEKTWRFKNGGLNVECGVTTLQ